MVSYKRISEVLIFLFLMLLAACQQVFAQPTVKLVLDPDIRTLPIGQNPREIALIARTDKQDVQFAWSLRGPGALAGDRTSPGVLYLPPDNLSGKQATVKATITVVVTDQQGQKTTEQIVLTLTAAQPAVSQEAPPPRPAAKTAQGVLTLQDPVSGMEMAFVHVPGGSYEMGCGPWADACGSDEQAHPETVADFWIGQFEVTRKQWRQVTRDTGRVAASDVAAPVDNISWTDAQTFLQTLAANLPQYLFRLPTEAEWEYACRSGGKPENYAGGSDPDPLAWYLNNSGRKIKPVGTKAPNGLGIYDMSGNVREWTQDCYASDYSHPDAGCSKVVRGGGAMNAAKYVRCTNREQYLPDIPKAGLGFRVVVQEK